MKKFLIFISIIFLSIFAFFFSNIKGYYRFKQYCEAEGGLKVYQPLERNVGWLAENKREALVVSWLDGIGSIEYYDYREGKRYLLSDRSMKSFSVVESSQEISPKYLWKFTPEIKDSEYDGLGRSKYEVIDIKTAKVLVSYTMFGFAWINEKHAPLGANIYRQCNFSYGKTDSENPVFIEKIQSSIIH